MIKMSLFAFPEGQFDKKESFLPFYGDRVCTEQGVARKGVFFGLLMRGFRQ